MYVDTGHPHVPHEVQYLHISKDAGVLCLIQLNFSCLPPGLQLELIIDYIADWEQGAGGCDWFLLRADLKARNWVKEDDLDSC